MVSGLPWGTRSAAFIMMVGACLPAGPDRMNDHYGKDKEKRENPTALSE